ncbi:50S ribosomal protein L31, partial [Francisella tularensis subsp. holarctica]
ILTPTTPAKNHMPHDTWPECHPFDTGKQRIVDTAGRVDKFKKRFGGMTKYN